jgi:hypothetical protein
VFHSFLDSAIDLFGDTAYYFSMPGTKQARNESVELLLQAPCTDLASVKTCAQPFPTQTSAEIRKADRSARQSWEKPPTSSTLTATPAANFVSVCISDFAAEPVACRPGPQSFVNDSPDNFASLVTVNSTPDSDGSQRKSPLEFRRPSRTRSAYTPKHVVSRDDCQPGGRISSRNSAYSERRRTTETGRALSDHRKNDNTKCNDCNCNKSYLIPRSRDKENVDSGPPIIFAAPGSELPPSGEQRIQSFPVRVGNPDVSSRRRRSVRLSLGRGLRYDADDCDVTESSADYQDDDYLLFAASPVSSRKNPSSLNGYLSRLVLHK